ncbi:hypothetical protein NKJ72_29975 [Mesorhizobium sp. M0045]|uniref:hypothetical protein n=1 Tax=Mesorhizobium sp. M0045 TaxID=2956857 RepID=UPI0033397436
MFDRRDFLAGGAAVLTGCLVGRPVLAKGLIDAYRTEPTGQGTSDGPGIAELWELDRRIYIQNLSNDRLTSFRIIGDIVELSDSLFPSLARPEGGILSGKVHLVVEARELIIDMPIRLDDGILIASAERVILGPSGRISFTEPGESFAQRLEIRAREISLKGGRQLPFEFRLEPSRRSVMFAAQRFVGRDGAPAEVQDASFDLVRRASLSYRVDGLANGAGGSPIVMVDSDGSEFLRAIATARWPDATALKLRTFFAREPYNADVQEFVIGRIAAFEEVFQTQQSSVAEIAASDLLTAISARTDTFGLLQSDVPMTSLDERLSRFSSLLEREFGNGGTAGEAAAWDVIAVAASRSGKIDVSAVAAAAEELQAKSREISEIDGERRSIEQNLTAIEDEISALNSRIRLQENFVKQQIEAKAYKNPNDNLSRGAQVIAAVGSVAFPAAAPFLVVASAAITAIDAVNRNDGDLLSKATDVAGVIQNHVTILNHAREVRAQWNKASEGFSVAKKYAFSKNDLTDAEKKAFEEWKSSVQKMKDEAKALYEILSKQAPAAEINFDDDNIRTDPALVALFEERNAKVKKQTVELERLAVALNNFEETTAAALKATALLAELQKLDLTNDIANGRAMQLADWVRTSSAREFAREAILLRRIVEYATGKPLVLPPDVLAFPEGDDAEQATFVMKEPGLLEEVLNTRRRERFAQSSLILSAAERAHKAAVDIASWNIPVPISFSAHISTNFGDEVLQAQKRNFISVLNRLLGDAIRTGAPSQPAPIPFTPGVIGATENAVLAGLNISELTFKSGREPNSDFILVVQHPRIGEIRRNGKTTVYSDAAAGELGKSELVLPPSEKRFSLPRDVHSDWKADLSQDALLSNVLNFNLPLLAPYGVRFEVANANDWSEAPEIESIRIDFITMNPR